MRDKIAEIIEKDRLVKSRLVAEIHTLRTENASLRRVVEAAQEWNQARIRHHEAFNSDEDGWGDRMNEAFGNSTNAENNLIAALAELERG